MSLEDAVIVALGSNLGWASASCEQAVEAALTRLGAVGMSVLSRSSLWRAAAWPDRSAPAYINAVALVETALCPVRALAALHGVEAEFGRTRGERNAARTLDLDLIAYGRLVRASPAPVLPHPRAAERRFVMGPLAEIAPDWHHPVLGASAADLAARAPVGADARPIGPPPTPQHLAPRIAKSGETRHRS